MPRTSPEHAPEPPAASPEPLAEPTTPEKPSRKGVGGAPKGSLNGLKTGSKLRRLTVGELPQSMIAVKREGRAYRRELEDAVMAAKGEVGIVDSHLIDTAAAATIQAGVCRWLLRNRMATMTTSEILNSQSSIVKAKERRDAAVRALQLDAKAPAPWLHPAPKVTDIED